MNLSSLELITTATVEKIIARLDPCPSIDSEKFPEILRRLRELFDGAFVEQLRSPRLSRSALDKSLKPLLKNIRSLRQRLSKDSLDPLRLALELSAFDLSGKTQHLGEFDVLQRLEQPLRELEDTVNHLCSMVDEFDQLDQADQIKWLSGGQTLKERYVRPTLYPYFRKRGNLGADTFIVRQIADLYEFAFGKAFSISPVKSAYCKPIAPTDAIKERGLKDWPAERSRYQGPAVRFACAVINTLEFTAFIIQSASDSSERSGTSSSAEDPISQVRLVNRVGDIWTNEANRKRTKSSPR